MPIPAAIWAVLALLVFAGPARAEPTFPPLSGRVVDAANILPAEVEARIDAKLVGLETQSRRQLVVVTLPGLQGYEISDYGYQLGRAWGIGGKERNDGAILIVAPTERKLRIEVGYGLEGVLTDGLSSLIINQTIVPRFKGGDMPGGIEAGVDAIVAQLSLPPEEAQRIAREASVPQQADEIDPMLIVFIVIVLFFFVLPILGVFRGARRYRGGGGVPPVIVWGSDGVGGSWSSSDSDFSGGGGDFGGGGASGDW